MITHAFSFISKSEILSEFLKTCQIVVSDSDYFLLHS